MSAHLACGFLAMAFWRFLLGWGEWKWPALLNLVLRGEWVSLTRMNRELGVPARRWAGRGVMARGRPSPGPRSRAAPWRVAGCSVFRPS